MTRLHDLYASQGQSPWLDNIRRGPAQAGTLGYWIGEPHARQGFMREAIKAVVHYAFQTLDLSRAERQERCQQLMKQFGIEHIASKLLFHEL